MLLQRMDISITFNNPLNFNDLGRLIECLYMLDDISFTIKSEIHLVRVNKNVELTDGYSKSLFNL